MEKIKINPFQYGEIVQRTAFCNRQDLMRRSREVIESEQNIAIMGERRTGKFFLAESGIGLPASVKRALERLNKLRIVYGSDKNYKFFDSFFKLWLRWRN